MPLCSLPWRAKNLSSKPLHENTQRTSFHEFVLPQWRPCDAFLIPFSYHCISPASQSNIVSVWCCCSHHSFLSWDFCQDLSGENTKLYGWESGKLWHVSKIECANKCSRHLQWPKPYTDVLLLQLSCFVVINLPLYVFLYAVIFSMDLRNMITISRQKKLYKPNHNIFDSVVNELWNLNLLHHPVKKPVSDVFWSLLGSHQYKKEWLVSWCNFSRRKRFTQQATSQQ